LRQREESEYRRMMREVKQKQSEIILLLVKLQNKEHLVQRLADAEKQGDKERKDRERELS